MIFSKVFKKNLDLKKKFQKFEDLNPFVGNFSENLDTKNFTKCEAPISVVRLCQGTLRSCEYCLQI